MEINFLNDANMTEFWEYAKMLLSTAAPGVMIWFAVVGVGLLLGIVVKTWRESAREQQEDDDDIDYRHY